ncbi:hypothetical protein DEU29_101218 [Idiomarina aquatica]|uniref:DUF2989 family protein n=1 Tax=Idiomarina aquatica TaxID=1327752 RepID=A0A4R6PPL7_9GAMM|nr:DUF2989 domain-containing protein [Idiomarina aquatica]TDP40669.1 hypothetical protein DEU29_101218 [Idiomarina aquatica]
MQRWMNKLALLSLTALLGLTACGERMPTVREMCDQDPGLCADLNEDNWCRAERRQLIISRYANKLQEIPENQYYLLKDLQKYSQCIELASGIEHRKLKSKQSHRIEAYLNSLDAIKALADKTATSDAPLLLYWHWANRSDTDALEQLLALENTKAMQSHELQFALATYYAKQDQDKVLSHLYNALRLYTPEQRFNVEIPESLVTYYLSREDVKNAYIWARVAIAFGSETMNEQQMRTIVNASDDQYDDWQDLAENIVDEIEDGEFKRRPDAS